MAKNKRSADDSPLSARELKTARRLKDDLAMSALIKRAVGRPVGRNKETIHIGIDKDVIKKLRSSGKGWQTRVNSLLRASVGLADSSIGNF